MDQIAAYTFETGELPRDWRVERTHHSFERGALRSGRCVIANVPLAGHGWRRLRVEVEVETVAGAVIECGDHLLNAVVDLRRHVHSLSCFTCTIAESNREIPKKVGSHLVVFELAEGRWRALVDGVEAVDGDDPKPAPVFGSLQLGFWNDCLVHRVRIFGEQPLAAPVYSCPPRKRDDFILEVCVDFPDDLMHAPFDARMLDEMFTEFTRWGVKRCHWIHYGPMNEGWWDHSELGAGENAHKTAAKVGDIFAAAVKASHAHGIELYGLIKPFDMGFWTSFGEGTSDAKKHGRLLRIGGPVGWVTHFVAQHPELLMARKPGTFGDAENDVFTRIDLVNEDAAPVAFGVNNVRIFVSDDNATYRPYAGPVTRSEVVEDYPVWEHTTSGGRPTGQTRRSRVMRFTDLAIRNKYVALAVNERAGSFHNALINLLHVFGPKGEERRLTYGLKPREGESTVEGTFTKEIFDGHHPDASFLKYGLEFDRWDGTPTACLPGVEGIRQRVALDAGHGFVAFARGKDGTTIATLSPFYPEARAWWLSWVRQCLDAGADGVDLRYSNHHSPFAWAEFGFEKPVRDEFLKRHGVDLWKTDDFDRAAWRRLRGEAYTDFYREARALTKQRGRALSLHVEQLMCVEPELAGGMEMHLDWRTWLDEGLADNVTAKNLIPGTRFAEEVLSHTRRRGMSVIHCPFANSLWRTPGGERVIADWIDQARAHGFDGFQFFECAAVVRGTRDGRIVMEQPALRDVFRKQFCR